MFKPSVKDIKCAYKKLRTLFQPTPLAYHSDLSVKYNSDIYLKREDLTPVRSYKIRGAFNKMSTVGDQPIVTCSAGNHAQGVAFSCNHLQIHGDIFMPKITTKQKIDKVKKFGGKFVNIFLEGMNFDESFRHAKVWSSEHKREFVHPFDDEHVIEGQATVGLEILEQIHKPIDYLIMPIGGGGLSAGVSSYFKEISPKTKIIGVEPLGAPSMYESIKRNSIVTLDTINPFVDGAAVKRVGNLNYPICKANLNDILLIDEGHVCSKILEMYNDSGYIIEPAGVLSLCALDILNEDIKNKTVVSVVSGGNSDVFRMPEIMERSLVYEGRIHYFRIEFPQHVGTLKEFLKEVLGKNDDIIYLKYTKIINRETGPVIIGIETKGRDDIKAIINNMVLFGVHFEKLSSPP